MSEEIINEINGKIEELKKLVKIYEEESRLYLVKKNERIQAGGSENDIELIIIQMYSEVYLQISEVIRSRAHEANCIIKSIQNPNDPGERVHANTFYSDEQISGIREYIIKHQKIFGDKIKLEIGINTEKELEKLKENQNFKMDY